MFVSGDCGGRGFVSGDCGGRDGVAHEDGTSRGGGGGGDGMIFLLAFDCASRAFSRHNICKKAAVNGVPLKMKPKQRKKLREGKLGVPLSFSSPSRQRLPTQNQ
jgi:hypothetical protein